MDAYLASQGFSYAKFWHYDQFRDDPETGNFAKVDKWPLPPFAPAHILLTKNEAMNHYVAMASDGEVLDPVFGRGRRIGDYDVLEMIGVWPQ